MNKNLLIKILCYFMLDARKRTNFLVKHHYFNSVGKNFVFFPRKVPQDPQFIKFHNNDVVATDVMFVNHDIIHEMLNHRDTSSKPDYSKFWGCIEIMDNVFIGARSLIMPNVKLGPNVIVAAGSVVTKNFSGGVIIGGNPARIIGNIDNLLNKRADIVYNESLSKEEIAQQYWESWKKNVT